MMYSQGSYNFLDWKPIKFVFVISFEIFSSAFAFIGRNVDGINVTGFIQLIRSFDIILMVIVPMLPAKSK